MRSYVPSSDLCMDLQYMHDNVVSENDQCLSGAVPLHSDLSCNSINNTRNVFDSSAVI